MEFIKKVSTFFDKLEEKIRTRLAHRPVLYALIGGVAVVLFWRGVEGTADMIPFLNGPVSLMLSIMILMAIGLFVSFFVGDDVLITSLRGEKKIAERTEEKIETEEDMLGEIEERLTDIEDDVEHLKANKKPRHHKKK